MSGIIWLIVGILLCIALVVWLLRACGDGDAAGVTDAAAAIRAHVAIRGG